MFKEYRGPGYEDAKLLKKKNKSFKQIDDYNRLISENMTFIKDKQNENRKNRNEVKKLTYKLNESIQKDPFISMNNSSSTSFSSPYSVLNPKELPQNWTEQEMRKFITEKIIKDRTKFIRCNAGGDLPKYWNKDITIEKMKEFKKIQILRKNYDPKTLKYYLPHRFKVDDDSRPDYIVAIPWYAMNCFDFVEYAAFDQMLYYADTYSYDTIPNPHVKVDGNKTTLVLHPLVRPSSTFKSNKKKDLYPKQKINSRTDHFLLISIEV
jgi:hypothetical protein